MIEEWTEISGGQVWCEVPAALGAITAMRIENGRLICDTESGIPFIVAAPSPQEPHV